MPSEFITNDDKLLSEVINDILPSTEGVSFLVGYFYFSGFKALYEQLVDKQVRILVGLDIEKGIHQKIQEVALTQELERSRGEVRQNYFESLVTMFNESNIFDNIEKIDAFKLFLKKIQNGALHIRKTAEPNHAKLYLFKKKIEFNEGGNYPGVMILGSSNLSISGLHSRHEANIVDRSSTMYNEAQAFFDRLWDESVEITKKDPSEFMHSVVERIWVDKLPKPYLLYIRVLKELFSIGSSRNIKLPSEITRDRMIDLRYQIDAISQAIDIINRHNGVIIADVVGLGKSIVASAVAHNLNLKTIIICPPHLKRQWEDYHYKLFNFPAKIISRGKPEDAFQYLDDSEQLIIIDEAHTFRNEYNYDYAVVHRLCQNNKVMLLTATPFNNRPQDIFAMIKLFQIPSRSTLQTVDNLAYEFRMLVKEYKHIKESQKNKRESAQITGERIKSLARQIREIISPLVIRRSRLDLEAIEEYKDDLKAQGIEFPKVNDPEMLTYNLGDLSELYVETLERIAPDDETKGFLGARYKPTTYLKDPEALRAELEDEFGDENLFKQSQTNLAKFMRHLLVRRFESSMFAFGSTLDSMIRSSEAIRDWHDRLGRVPIYKKGKLPDVDDLEAKIGENQEDFDFEEELTNQIEKGLRLIKAADLKPEFIADVKKDIKLLKDIKKQWFGVTKYGDPKLEAFCAIIKKQLKQDRKRKIVVFSEFKDTAEYVYDHLKNTLRIFKYSSDDATERNKEIIRSNFDAGYENQADDYDVLMATDAISEGFNLHRAGTVFNYDIPFNPTRVIQRIGRINRINLKVFDQLFIYNFFPTAIGETETRVKEISTLKIAMIHALMGEDMKVLTKDEELASYYKEEFRRLNADADELSWDAKYRNELSTLRRQRPEILVEAEKVPKRVRIRRNERKKQSGVLIFAKKGADHVFRLANSPKENVTVPAEEAVKLLEAEIAEQASPVSKSFEPIYQSMLKELFVRKTQVIHDKGRQMAIDKIRVLIEQLPDEKDYLEDLLFALDTLDAIPDYIAKAVRKIKDKTLPRDFAELKNDAPHEYLVRIRKAARQVDEGEEVLIFSEELI